MGGGRILEDIVEGVSVSDGPGDAEAQYGFDEDVLWDGIVVVMASCWSPDAGQMLLLIDVG